MTAPRSQTIPVFLLVKAAFQVLWQQRDDGLRLGFVPTLVSFAALAYSHGTMIAILRQMQAGATQVSSGDSFTIIVSALVSLVALAVLAANWLRFMLLGPMGAIGLGLNLGRSHASFVVTCVVLFFVSGIALSVLSMPTLLLKGVLQGIGVAVAFVLVLVGVARLLPFAAAQAIGQPLSLQQAWAATRGNGVALASALVLVLLPNWIVLIIVTNILYAVGFGTTAPFAMLFIAAAFQSAGVILQATVLASAYRHLVGIKV